MGKRKSRERQRALKEAAELIARQLSEAKRLREASVPTDTKTFSFLTGVPVCIRRTDGNGKYKTRFYAKALCDDSHILRINTGAFRYLDFENAKEFHITSGKSVNFTSETSKFTENEIVDIVGDAPSDEFAVNDEVVTFEGGIETSEEHNGKPIKVAITVNAAVSERLCFEAMLERCRAR